MFKASHQRPSRNASHINKACVNDFVQRGWSSQCIRLWDRGDFVSLLLKPFRHSKFIKAKKIFKHYTTKRFVHVLKRILQLMFLLTNRSYCPGVALSQLRRIDLSVLSINFVSSEVSQKKLKHSNC